MTGSGSFEFLERLGFLKREIPVTARPNTKNTLYRIEDNYLNFYFRFVERYRDSIELENLDFWEEFLKEYNNYLGFAFESVARQFLIELNRAGKLPFRFTKIGRWWCKGEEIDLVALNERERKALFVEVKWKDLSEREARGILKDLKRKAEFVRLDGWKKSYGLVAKSVEGKEELRKEGHLVWDLRDFEMLAPYRTGM